MMASGRSWEISINARFDDKSLPCMANWCLLHMGVSSIVMLDGDNSWWSIRGISNNSSVKSFNPKFPRLMRKSTGNPSGSHIYKGFIDFPIDHFWNKRIQYQVSMDVTTGHHCPTDNAAQLNQPGSTPCFVPFRTLIAWATRLLLGPTSSQPTSSTSNH